MTDIFHVVGGDVSASSTGDLATVDGTTKGQQRVLRRLITNPGDYPDHPEYGAGISAAIGSTFDASKLRSMILGQMLLESVVAKIPEPTIKVEEIAGGIRCAIGYVDSIASSSVTLNFDITR